MALVEGNINTPNSPHRRRLSPPYPTRVEHIQSEFEDIRSRDGAPWCTTSHLLRVEEQPRSQIIGPPTTFSSSQGRFSPGPLADISITILRTSEDKGTISKYWIIELAAHIVTSSDTLRCLFPVLMQCTYHERSVPTSRLMVATIASPLVKQIHSPVQRLRLIGSAELMWCTTANKVIYMDPVVISRSRRTALSQVQDMDEEDSLSGLCEGLRLGDSPPESDSELEQAASLRPLGYASPHADASVSDGTIALHTQDASDATALGTQSYHNPNFPTTPQPDSWEPASTRIPPELFDTILFYLCLGYNPGRWSNDTSSCRQITMCSLVCIRWANLCRQVLFCKRKLTIHSSEEVQTFVKYATQGCPSLIPIHTLIESISVEQRYDIRYSFCNRIYMLKAKYGIRLSELSLIGPVPEEFPSSGLDTPHWGLPPSVITPPSLLSYNSIRVHNVHLPSFRHVCKYVRHFAQAGSIGLSGLTWDTDGPEPQLPFYRRGSRKVKNRSFCSKPSVLAVSDVRLQELWGKNSGSCHLRTQGPEESEELPIIRISADLGPAWYLTFHLCNLAAENAQTSDVHVVGVTLNIRRAGKNGDVDSLIPYLGHFPMLCAALLRFESYQDLLTAMECHRPLSFNPRPVNGQGCTYVFTCLRDLDDLDEFPEVPRANDSDYDYVEIDPITLSPTGWSWAYNGLLSSYDLGLLLTRESLRQTGNIPPAFT
ncbi:hypothetical protein BDY19DRAFT_909660 [Irpex rosettiformis]|uniref:Uncharacterized protein n=1 Tax=Irpex rosettiformis TaxID=378272 RepID=A0ACB8TRF6_9APHY|nr:hypothetical protein BDY19DRAFT_909660 [Irpex rosettiformis]